MQNCTIGYLLADCVLWCIVMPYVRVSLHHACFLPVGFLNDGRDLTGAIDGTKNPDVTLRTVVEQASIGPRDYAGGAHLGGSFVFCSKFAHRLEEFRAMDAEQQASVSVALLQEVAAWCLEGKAAISNTHNS